MKGVVVMSTSAFVFGKKLYHKKNLDALYGCYQPPGSKPKIQAEVLE